MIRKLELEDEKTVNEILNLQKLSYAVEADMIGYSDIPPLKDNLNSLQNCGEIFYGYYMEGTLAGLIAYKIESGILDIHRVAVHPSFFRKGIAQEMLRFIESLEYNVYKIIVSTGSANKPAVNLYTKAGFVETGGLVVGNGLYLSLFEKLK